MTFKIFKRLAKISIMEVLNYRKTSIILFFVTVSFFLLEILSAFVFYKYTDNLAGLNRTDYFNLILTSNIIISLHAMLLSKGHNKVINGVLSGTMDYVFIRPVNSFLYYVFNGIDLQNLVNTLLYVSIQLYLLSKQNVSFQNVLLYVLLVLLGTIYIFIINYFIIIITFYTDKATSLLMLPELLDSIGKNPKGIYPSIVSFIFSFIISYLIVYNAPIYALKNSVDYRVILYFIASIVVLSYILYKLWFISIKKYQSAN